MLASSLISLTLLGLGLAAPLPKNCATNVDINGPNMIHAGCTIKLQFLIPSRQINTINGLKVEMYPSGSRRGVVVHQVSTVDIQSQKDAIEILFPITSRFIGNDTLILTGNPPKDAKIGSSTQCPSVYGVHKLQVLPSSPDVMCMF
ncbi:hypothetical protein K7432_002510 [Basidiobolus ranarum]|uniref:Uncharacterized protein n=1 Tax=Basidiobolus ranarum TaxID=34480 RepID=A0ABR2W7P0_9FUNG